MSQLLISLGLQKFVQPIKKKFNPLTAINEARKDATFRKLCNALSGRVMSTRDLAHQMKIERSTCAAYMSKLRDVDGLVEVVGETIHAGDSAKQFVWRLK